MPEFGSFAGHVNVNRVVEQINKKEYDITAEQVYHKVVLDTIKLGKEEYVHLNHAREVILPIGAEKMTFRRFGGLTAHPTPLLEGIPPAPDFTSMQSFDVGLSSFGRWIPFTDRFNFDQVYPQVWHYTSELADVMVRTKERIARDTFLSAPAKAFGSNKTSVGELVHGDIVDVSALRYLVLRLGRLLVKPVGGGLYGKYHYISSPEMINDLFNDPLVRAYMRYEQTTRQLFTENKPIELFELKFIKTSLDEHYTPELDHVGEYYDGTEFMLRVFAEDETTNKTIYLNISGAEADGFRTIKKGTTYLRDGTAIKDKVLWDISAGAISTATKGGIGTIVDHVANTEVEKVLTANDVLGLTFYQLPVHKGILFGHEALITAVIEGDNAGVETIFKQLGSSGSSDPLNQIQSVGVKVNGFGVGLERPEAVVVTLSVPHSAAFSALTAGVVAMAKSANPDTAPIDVTDSLEFRKPRFKPEDVTHTEKENIVKPPKLPVTK